MSSFNKLSNKYKRIISMLMIIFQMRVFGFVSNTVNMKGVYNYDKLVTSFAEFLEEEGVDDVQNIYEYFNYAMWNGYFSKDHELKYSGKRKLYIDNAGMSLASGRGVCLNYADMLSLIYKKLGYNSSIAMCYVDSDNVSISPIRTDKDVDRKVESGMSLDNVIIDGICKVFGNHAITCVENNGEIYYFDPTNFAYLNKDGFNDISIVNGKGKFDLRYFTTILFENANIVNMMINRNDKEYNSDVIDKELVDIDKEALDKFYSENKDIIDKIDRVNNFGTNAGFFEFMLFSFIASNIIKLIRYLNSKLAYKLINKERITSVPKIIEYFNSINIKNEYEALINYEELLGEFGIKDNILKDIFKKSIYILDNILNDNDIYSNMLSILLNEMGYHASVIYGKKYKNKVFKKYVKLVKFYKNKECNNDEILFDDSIWYIYDIDSKELLYSDGDVYKSLDGKCKYDIINIYDPNREDVINEMKDTSIKISKEDIKVLRKNKSLRK